MNAGLLSIGDELTLGQSVDTNTAWLSSRLAEAGVTVVEHRTVPDDTATIARALHDLTSGCQIIITTGGLGPTPDDLTREGLNQAVSSGKGLVEDQAGLEHLEKWFTRRGKPMPKMNHKQALRPDGAELVDNPHGTAMGIAAATNGCLIYCLPGPPGEMQPMVREHIMPRLCETGSEKVWITETVHSVGLGESDAAARLGDLLDRARTPTVGTTVSGSIVSARIRGHGKRDVVKEQVEATAREIQEKWRPYAFGRGEQTLVHALADEMADATFATAESCSGGLLASMIVSVPGSSSYYLGGWVTYCNQMKIANLHVPGRVIAECGAVSDTTARAMAVGARHQSGSDYSLAITGIAGPDGGSVEKPVGTVYVALAGPEETCATRVRHFRFAGNREQIRQRSALAALQMLRFRILGVYDDTPLLWQVASHPQPESRETVRT